MALLNIAEAMALASIHFNAPNVSRTGELKNWMPIALTGRALGEWMDTVFLKIPERDCGKGSRYPMHFFERSDVDTMVAFLSGRATWWERLLVSSALPTLPLAVRAPLTLTAQVPQFLGARR